MDAKPAPPGLDDSGSDFGNVGGGKLAPVWRWLKRNVKLLPSITWPDAPLHHRSTLRGTALNTLLVLACAASGIAFLCAIDRLLAACFP